MSFVRQVARRVVQPTFQQSKRSFGASMEYNNLPSWYTGDNSEKFPVRHPLKPGLIFYPDFSGSNAPTEEEWASGKIVIPALADSLEWMLSSPPPLHQFDEPPIIVELPPEYAGYDSH